MDERERRNMDVWIQRRESPLVGAVAAHLAELSDAELQEVPFCCDVMVDLKALLYDLVDVSAVSLAWRSSPDDRAACAKQENPDHHFCSTFIYALNTLDPYPAQKLAHESPYRSVWIALTRREKLSLLVADFVSQHAAEFLLHELIQEELLDPDKSF